jgi:AraC family transcriptional regulator, regulatory protein of adaptative response / methylated-DNA-[protein]-cysteine methyltransferase
MSLDVSLCETAWMARDAAYDGAFFVCVRTTGIYCRCVCPVKPPLRRNIEFLPSAAAAELAGYRPCLRCRPETAPFCPAWKGTLAIVEKAARLIKDEGALDGGGNVEALAERVGIGSRHLTRLFRRHLGASPTEVAKTARVQRAKRLITDTDLAMTAVALQAGFGSLRRFNAVFSEVYKRSPSEMRRGRGGLNAMRQLGTHCDPAIDRLAINDEGAVTDGM